MKFGTFTDFERTFAVVQCFSFADLAACEITIDTFHVIFQEIIVV